MGGVPPLEGEVSRIAGLSYYEILDADPEEEFEEIIALVKAIYSLPYAAISLIDHDRQWTKLAGVAQADCMVAHRFHEHAIRHVEPLVVEDTLSDARFRHYPASTDSFGLRSYLGVPLLTPDGDKLGVLCVFGTEARQFTVTDIHVVMNFAKIVMSQFELRLTARLDGLTGLLTQRAFGARLERVAMGKASEPATLILIDLDRFKAINDEFGHPVGDLVLKSISAVMSSTVRKTDSIGRVGGDEFAILLKGCKLSEARRLADRLRTALAEVELKAIGNRTQTASMGIAEYDQNETAGSWYKRADRALYAAKRSGRDRAIFAGEPAVV